MVLDLYSGAEFLEEPKVVLEVMAEVVDLPLEHGNSLDTHTEGESAVLLAVYAAGLKNVRVNHAASEDLEPTGALADVASLALADVAADVNLG